MAGILSRLASLVPGYSFGAPKVAATPPARTSRRDPPTTDERVPGQLGGGVAGRIFFLPYADNTSTGDSAEIRSAMRLMLRDPFVKSGWLTQVLTVLSQDFQVHHPSSRKNPQAQEQIDFVRHNLENADGEMVGVGSAVLMNLGSDGMSLAEKVWHVQPSGKYGGKTCLKGLKPKDPTYLTLVGDEFKNVTGVRVNRTNETFPISDFCYTRYLHTFDEPYGMAAFRAGYGSYWMRDTCRKLRAIHLEKKSAGMLKGTYEDPADKPALDAALRKAAASTWISVPTGTQLEALAISTASEPDFKSFDDSLREETLISLAFASLHILQGAVTDARGDSKTQKAISDLGPWLLTYLVQLVINKQLIPDLIDYNFSGGAADGIPPRITLGGVTNKEALELLQLLEGGQRAGFSPSKSYYASALTIQEADPDDPDDQLAPPQQPGMGGMGGAMPGMGGDPFGGGGMGGGFGAPPGGPPPAPSSGEGFGPEVAFSERGQPGNPWESFGWTAGQSRTRGGGFGVKAVGTGPDAGKVLYGKRAQAALSRGGSGEGGPPSGGAGGTTAEGSPSRPNQAGSSRRTSTPKPTSTQFTAAATAAATGDPVAAKVLTDHGNATVASALEGIAGAGPTDPSTVRNTWNHVGRKLPVQVQRNIGDNLARAATSGNSSVAGRAARNIIGFIGRQSYRVARMAVVGLARLGVSLAKSAASAGWDATKAAGRAAAPVAFHLGALALGAGLIASAAYVPASLPIVAKLAIAVGGAVGIASAIKPLGRQTGKLMFGAHGEGEGGGGCGVGHGGGHGDDEDEPATGNPWDRFADIDLAAADEEIALAGPDGKRAAELLAAAKREGREVLARIAEQAVRRLLSEPDPLAAPVLFTDEELQEIADSLAATTATADLLGRAIVHRKAEIAERASRVTAGGGPPSPTPPGAVGVSTFADPPEPTDPFYRIEPLPLVQPAAAMDYFRGLVPTLSVSPLRHGPLFDRHAFTLAVATDQALLGRVKDLLSTQLATGRSFTPAQDLQDILTQAGVNSRSPAYPEMVYRTNMQDAFNQGQTAEMQAPGMQEVFPVWEYMGIPDGRQGDDHAPRFCDGQPGAWIPKRKFYPASVSFHEVRGPRVFNCRCSQAAVSKWEWDRLQREEGYRVETSW